MDNIIMTVGTSLVENYIANNPKKENITKEDILRYYEEEKIEDFSSFCGRSNVVHEAETLHAELLPSPEVQHFW